VVEEKHPGAGFLRVKFGASDTFPNVSRDQLIGHFRLLVDGGLVSVPTTGWQTSSGIYMGNLTNRGYEMLDSIRDKDIWQKAKESTLDVKDLSIEMIGRVAKAYVKKKLEDATGLKIDGL
jgi:hypothetical protein